jgi:hypothetical protein
MAKKPPAKPTVESILKECAKEVKRGLGRKGLGREASKFWTETYTETIGKALEDGGESSGRSRRPSPQARSCRSGPPRRPRSL